MSKRASSKKSILQVLGVNVRFFRHRLGISQEELAERADLHRTYIGGIERGERNPTIINIGKLAFALKVQPYELLIERNASADES